jgi:hypothetical protein
MRAILALVQLLGRPESEIRIVDLRNMVDDEDYGEDGPIQVGPQGTELEFVDKLQEQERIAADPRLRINQGDEDSDDEE